MPVWIEGSLLGRTRVMRGGADRASAWRIGTPWESAIRLTYSPANDQWPDLLPE